MTTQYAIEYRYREEDRPGLKVIQTQDGIGLAEARRLLKGLRDHGYFDGRILHREIPAWTTLDEFPCPTGLPG